MSQRESPRAGLSLFAELPAPAIESMMAIRTILSDRRALMAADRPLCVHDIGGRGRMASIAGRNACMVHRECGKRCRADMTQVAIRISSRGKRNVQSVRIVGGTFRGRSVVARSADPCDVAVMETCAQP